jgi:LuxR family maltose regulon positive regulatory protein
MATPLLTTKLYIPQPRPHGHTVSRPRLIKRLDEGLRLCHKLTLISAPAGFGKTTLLSEWISEGARDRDATRRAKSTETQACDAVPIPCFSWLSLDEGDNDPTQFWTYLIAALQTIPSLHKAGIGESALAMLRSPAFLQSETPPIQALLTGLINEIVEASREDTYVLVLDDYHLIEAQPIHDALAFLIDHLPQQLHLVLATRSDPPLPIARLRGRGQVTELRQSDLRFSPEEATAFLNLAMGLNVSPDDIATLTGRTEGWIAGLQMAAVSMQGQDTLHVTEFVQAFTGSHRYVLDYLVEEVLQRQPEAIQRFLLQTSILERLCAALCDALFVGKTEKTKGEGGEAADSQFAHLSIRQFAHSQEILEYLERANLFVVPLDDRREWYRYHRLLADLLQKRLLQWYPDLVPALYVRASTWHEQHGQVAEAIQYALSGQAFERAAHLIEQAAQEVLMRSQVATLLRWIEGLPDSLVRARPALSTYAAWALVFWGHPWDAVEARLQNVDADLIIGQVTAMRAFMAVVEGRVASAVELCRQALERLPEDDVFLQSLVSWLLSASYLSAGDLDAGSQMLEETIQVSQESGNVMVAAGALTQAARLHVRKGQLVEAKAVLEQAIELATDERGRALPVAGRAMITLGDLLREWNDLDAAVLCLEQGIELMKQWRDIAAMPGYIALARAKQAQGDVSGAVEATQRAQQLAKAFDATDWDDVLVDIYQARLWIAQGNIEAAVRWAEKQVMVEDEEDEGLIRYHLKKYEDMVRARLLIAQGRHDEALALLASLLSMLEQQKRQGLVIEFQILKALALRAKAQSSGPRQEADLAQAMTALERALLLAEPGGYVRIFVDEGQPMAHLLREAAARGIAADYVNRLLNALEGDARKQEVDQSLPPSIPSRPPLVEPLSEREFEVLRLLRSRLSTPEIARELYISVHTVRSHVKSIYGKLGVHRRADAVQQAEDLGLL